MLFASLSWFVEILNVTTGIIKFFHVNGGIRNTADNCHKILGSFWKSHFVQIKGEETRWLDWRPENCTGYACRSQCSQGNHQSMTGSWNGHVTAGKARKGSDSYLYCIKNPLHCFLAGCNSYSVYLCPAAPPLSIPPGTPFNLWDPLNHIIFPASLAYRDAAVLRFKPPTQTHILKTPSSSGTPWIFISV